VPLAADVGFAKSAEPERTLVEAPGQAKAQFQPRDAALRAVEFAVDAGIT
jgi:hypothetical protein